MSLVGFLPSNSKGQSRPIFKGIALSLGLFFTAFSFNTYAAPKSEPWPYWNKSNEADTRKISHQSFQTLLDSYLKRQGQHTLFNYAAVNKKDKAKLANYISQLSKIDPRTFNKKEQFAYWVNLYNALTISQILDNYPVSSITKIGGFFDFGPWNEPIIQVAGKKLTLNDIEHQILRPIWQDPRIHYVVNCASLGCPNLSQQALTSANSEKELELAATQFINSEKGVAFKQNTLELSTIYDWYAVDFGPNQKALFEHIDKYRKGRPLKNWQGKIDYQYDWDLNETK